MVDAMLLIAALNSNSVRELVGRYLRLLFVAFTYFLLLQDDGEHQEESQTKRFVAK